MTRSLPRSVKARRGFLLFEGYAQERIGQLFGVARNTVGVWLNISNSNDGNTNNPDCRTKIPAPERPCRAQLVLRYWRHLDLHVDTVEQRPGDATAVTLHLLWGAMTAPAAVAQVSTGAGLRCHSAILR